MTTAIGVNIDHGHDNDQELHMTVTELMTNDLTSIQDVVAFCRDGNANHVIQKIMETAEDLRKSLINRKINQVHSIFYFFIKYQNLILSIYPVPKNRHEYVYFMKLIKLINFHQGATYTAHALQN